MLVIIIKTHGKNGGVYGVDDEAVEPKEYLTRFDSVRCEKLEDRPKMFIFVSCRGDAREQLVSRHRRCFTLPPDNSTLELAGPSPKEPPRKGIHATASKDQVIFYSCAEGTLSVGSPSGTWMVQALVKILREYGVIEDITQIFTRLCHSVIDERSLMVTNLYKEGLQPTQRTERNAQITDVKQTPWLSCSLEKRLFMWTPPEIDPPRRSIGSNSICRSHDVRTTSFIPGSIRE